MRRETTEATQPIAQEREIRGLYFTAFGHGPIGSVLIIFAQLLVVKQTKYLAAENSSGEKWIEWREKFADGALCNGTGLPYPKAAPEPYARPEGYDDDCVWFPSDKSVPGLGVQYTNAIVYGTTAILFTTGVLLLIVGPFSDYGHYRKQLLIGCIAIWIPVLSAAFLVSDPDLYGVALTLTVIGTIPYIFGLRSPFASYLPLLINAHHTLVQWRQQNGLSKESVTLGNANSIELTAPTVGDVDNFASHSLVNEELEQKALRTQTSMESVGLEASDTLNGGDQVLGDAYRPTEDEDDERSALEEFQRLREAVAGKTAINESASFIAGQFFCLIIQFTLFTLLSDAENPKDTLGERSAILAATIWATIFCFLGISRFENRPGQPFPPGNRLLIGGKRSIKTFKLLYTKMPRLLALMIGRMLFWLAIQTVFAMSTLFFEREFAMGADQLAPAILIYFAVGIPSAIATSQFLQRYSGNLLKVFRVYCLLIMCIPLYLLLGVRERFEVYVLMMVSAALISPFPAMVRAMMTDMIPQGFSATIMSFEGLLENCTTWIGPLVVGGLLDLTDSLCFSLFALEMFFAAGLPFVFYAHLQKGHEERLAVERLTLQHSLSNESFYKSSNR